MMIDVDLQLYYANITSYKGVDVNKLCSIHHCQAHPSCNRTTATSPSLAPPVTKFILALLSIHCIACRSLQCAKTNNNWPNTVCLLAVRLMKDALTHPWHWPCA